MSGVTGVELGPDCCVLVRGGRLGAHRTVAAAASIPSSDWPTDRHTLVERLREVRRRHDLPSRARVVVWGDDETGSARNLIGGSGLLPQALAHRLGERVLMDAAVEEVAPSAEGVQVRYRRQGSLTGVSADYAIVAFGLITALGLLLLPLVVGFALIDLAVRFAGNG